MGNLGYGYTPTYPGEVLKDAKDPPPSPVGLSFFPFSLLLHLV